MRAPRPGSTREARSSCSMTRTARCGTSKMIAEGLALIDKAIRHRRPGPYQIQAAIAALHARAKRPEDTDWAQIDALYAALERIAAVARRHAEPRRRGLQGARTGGGARDDRAARAPAARAISISTASRAGCCMQLGRRPRRATPSTAPSRSPTRRRSRAYPHAPRQARTRDRRQHCRRLAGLIPFAGCDPSWQFLTRPCRNRRCRAVLGGQHKQGEKS